MYDISPVYAASGAAEARSLPEGESYRAEFIGAWEMSVMPGAIYSGRVDIPMPGKAYQALVLRRAA
jgi:hypothetical protein